MWLKISLNGRGGRGEEGRNKAVFLLLFFLLIKEYLILISTIKFF